MLVYMGKTKRIPEQRFFVAEWGKVTGVRQRDLAADDDVDLTKGFISGLWSNRKEPSPNTQAKIAAKMKIPPHLLQVHPDSPAARAWVALHRIPKEKLETAVEMLEGLARQATRT